MAFGVAILILIFGLITALLLSQNKSKKRKYIIWGITTMIVVSPLLSWLIGILYGALEGDGFAAAAMMILLFPFLFVVGLIVLIVGIFTKRESESG